MRILLLGAGGFIGRHILADLLSAGHQVVGVARSTHALAQAFPEAKFLKLDLARAVRMTDWSDHIGKRSHRSAPVTIDQHGDFGSEH